MAITIGKQPEHDFTNPLGLLGDCHRRIEYFLGLLITVNQQAQGGTLNPEQHEALEAALVYFQKAAPKHTLDEEESLFPRMRAARNPQAQAALAMLEALEADHQVADRLHQQVESLAQQWLKEGNLSAAESRQLTATLDALSGIYQRHIAVEDQQIFPLAGSLLEKSELAIVGREMAARRGLDVDALRAKLQS